MEDLDAIEAVEAACFPPAEAASNESLTARVAAYPDHFWLLVNTDDDDTPFPIIPSAAKRITSYKKPPESPGPIH